MNGIRSDLDVSFLTGQQLIQVCIGEYQVQLHFVDPYEFSIEGEVTINGRRGKAPQLAALFCDLVGGTITRAEVAAPGDLRLMLGENNLTLHDSEECYESYSFYTPKGLVVV
jgi:hypothetical protein